MNDVCAAWRDKCEKFNLGIEKFGVDIDDLKISAAPKRCFRFLIEYWMNPPLKKNCSVARAKLSEKFLGLFFRDIDDVNKVLYTISRRHMEYEKVSKGGWNVLAEPSNYYGTGLNCLDPFQINKGTLIYLIKKTEDPTANSVHII